MRTGDVANLKSQICKNGEWSSSEERHICVAISGCQATCCAFIFDILSLTLIILSFFLEIIINNKIAFNLFLNNKLLEKRKEAKIVSYLRSQTTHLPLQVDARICCTCLFQATQLTSSAGWTLAPGVIGSFELFKSQMKISLALAPLASKLLWKGLRSNADTIPVWFSRTFTNAESLFKIFS